MKESEALKVLASDAKTYDKAMACDLLGRVGTAKAVPALAKLLADAQLNDYARDGLERIPDPAAGKALLDALKTLVGDLRVGVIITLGDRREKAAVPALATIAKGSDATAAGAALAALAQIGTEDAAKAILDALGSGKAKVAAAHAALAAAGRTDKDTAQKLRAAVAGAEVPSHLKKAAGK